MEYNYISLSAVTKELREFVSLHINVLVFSWAIETIGHGYSDLVFLKNSKEVFWFLTIHAYTWQEIGKTMGIMVGMDLSLEMEISLV